MEQPTLYDYCKECLVWRKYPELCFAYMDVNAQKEVFNGACAVKDEDSRVPKEIALPRGLNHGGIEASANG